MSRKAAKQSLAKDIWPQERDLMLRPERLRYVRKLIKVDGCVFCNALKSKESYETFCIYQGKHAMLMLNKFPYNSGHVMVLPKRHVADITDLSQAEYAETQELIRRAVSIIKIEYKISGLNIGLNMGAVAGAGIPDHLHWHIIPRWHGDTNFFPLIAETKVISETLETIYNRFRKHFVTAKKNGK